MIFKRKLYDEMLDWKRSRQGATALLVQGARRVGKSTLVEHFARCEYKSYILLDFSKTSKRLNELFEDMMDLDFFFLSLQNLMGVKLYPRESVIIFDEVQFQPLARQAIKHLVADGRYDFIETGSLISIRKNVKDILIPSEETRMTLYPLDFDEFLWATGDEVTPIQLREAFSMWRAVGQAVHRKWMRLLRTYMLVGGMPQSVVEYILHNNLRQCDDVKREIIALYDQDFRKIDAAGRLSGLFNAIPSQLTNNAQRYKVGPVVGHQTRTRIMELLADLEDSQTILIANQVNDPNVGMEMSKDLNHYKMFAADTGLFVTLAFKDKNYTDNIIYQKLLSDKLAANLGYVYENLIAQMLVASGNKLFYYTFPSGKGNNNYEIDFLLSKGNKLCPVEVKSSGYKTHASLDAFCEKYSSRVNERILLYTKDYQKNGPTHCVPIYYAGLLTT